ncbi:nuclear transport factor 2 family protein [Thermorudis peleae]|uniref:nuclear transport factor 2 family protein n=1 Tax=Thermorudis peleae TaxID=1382356 RepID=UPI00056E20EC|nr:nuclear transport factor 2 family protein [Thermorudis peleae]
MDCCAPQSPREVVHAVLAALNRGDIEEALRYCAEDIVLWSPGPELTGQEVHGKAQLRALLEANERYWPDTWCAIQTFIADGEHVAVELMTVATHNGRRVIQPMAAFFTVRDGLIVRQANYFDLAALIATLTDASNP